MTDSRYIWLKIAEIFSQCKFSYKKDKAVAIAGLVRRKQQMVKEFQGKVSPLILNLKAMGFYL